jgi:hypothetical protein
MAAEHNRMANRIQLRRDTTANWNNVNPVLADGEPGYDIVTNEIRIGDGSNTWSQLSANTISGGGASTGNVTFSGINIIGDDNLRFQPNVSATDGYVDIYLTTGPDIHIDNNSGNLILGKDNSANVRLATDGNVQIRAQDVSSTSTWTFDPDGTTTLPLGGTITEANVGLAEALILTPANISYPGQQLRIYSTGVVSDGNHLHLTTGNLYASELYLGDDNYYVKLANTGNVQIRATTQSLSSTALWDFDTSGNLTLPYGGVINEIPDTVTLSGTQTDGSVNATYTRDKSNNNYYVLSGSNWSILYNSGTYGLTYIPQGLVYMQSTDLVTWTLGPTPNLDLETPSTGVIGVGSTKITSKDKTWSFDTSGNLTMPQTVMNTSPAPVSWPGITFSDGTLQKTAYQRVTGSWTVTTGSADYSFTVPQNGTYTMWVRGNIPNGIITWNATATVTNNNVPVLGQQYAWNYNGVIPIPLEITALPVQFIGTANTIITSNTYGGGPSNTFTFTVNNASGSPQTVYWGYVAQ